MTVQDKVRGLTGGILERIARRLWELGIHPDFLTILGTVFVFIAASQIVYGRFQLAAVILIAGLPLDALDGAVARVMGRPHRKFGGILDSTLDRYADGFLFGGLIIYFAIQQQILWVEFSVLALVGSFTTSYVRARAGEAGLSVKIGMLDRLLRLAILLLSLFIPSFLPTAILVLAIAGNLTTVQRLLYARRHLE